jgi:ADP-ribosylglycohydrolase
MRTAPVGVLCPSSRLDDLIRVAYECAIPTHGGQLAICAAAAVAGAVSAALEGRSRTEVLNFALKASQGAESLRPSGEPSIMTRSIERAYSDLAMRKHLAVDEVARQYFPDKPQTIVPLAISLALITESAETTALFAANLGGDSDSVASIGGAIAGAHHPETVNEKWFELVTAINQDNLLDMAASLATLRRHG